MGRVMPAGRRQACGFSLIEVLVAFVVFALTITALLAAFTSATRLATLSEDYTRATLLAESRLAALASEDVAPGEIAGEFDGRFRWRVAIEPFAIGPDAYSELQVAPYWVTVEVSWPAPGDDGDRSVRLATLLLAPKV